MKENFLLRLANSSDVEQIARLVNSAYRGESSKNGWTTEADILGGQRTDSAGILELIEKKNSCILIFEMDQKIVASVHLEKKNLNTAYLGMFTVSPKLQGQGIGKKLMKAAELYAKGLWQVSVMEMTVITVREELLNWYFRHGYQRTDEYIEFPYGDERFGIPLRPDLKMVVLRKSL